MRTDEAGRFVISGLEPGLYQMHAFVHKEGKSTKVEMKDVSAGATGLVLRFE